ncbi:MAG: CRISPR-associated protein Cas4 [Rhodocyclaceae bacterium]|nr:CRISPR-associated protein Cas4 [Rhodocyclaceae bacterium]MCP5240687.1 CRISPR-associated protein Cas4 [Zoogloeaceae bacterium]MCB1911121.1 CRISPR-associated protein Cas4 [Rhodocyclaceae bacterium]MCP5253201.1 CRISPR-associated protein Cas4 [Zoogloeaceae bacterium]MCP5293458.1 CRISPR-associated protein Cas4 [Zoogloeaceae bacterium]
MNDGDDPIPLSALQHWAYCPRQCALIHLEQLFEDNLYTQRGQAVHARADQAGVELRPGLRVERALPLWSERLGLIGKADVVEFLPDGSPYPIEYKHGNRNKKAAIAACDDLQLAGQALCLEEMSGHPVPEGALFYAGSKRRRTVSIGPALRERVESAVGEIRRMLAARHTPPPVNDERCRACSLRDLCQPDALTRFVAERRDLFDPDA